jgi:hypothetical protein
MSELCSLASLREGGDMTTRSSRQIASEALRDAQQMGIVSEYSVRDEGRATVYPWHRRYKFYTNNVLDTLRILGQLEREAEEWLFDAGWYKRGDRYYTIVMSVGKPLYRAIEMEMQAEHEREQANSS